ncbi:MAG: iron-only hydrogenase system regulator [Ruminococcaceae bacterium]|nr:iron-only hydrogenase system regulator [Oscillospiraceae bacterium]
METRVAVISMIVENLESIPKLNDLLHSHNAFIIGRMGIPYSKRDINIISIAIDAPLDTINTLTGLLGRLDGVTAKVAYSKSTSMSCSNV